MFIVPLTSMPSIEALNTIDKNDRTEEKDGSGSFGDILKQKIQSVKDLEMQSLQSAYDISTGASSDIESAMIDATKASTAIETTVQLTTRAVNAYKEIMSSRFDFKKIIREVWFVNEGKIQFSKGKA